MADAKRAVDFLYKLDAKRFKKMLVSMRNNALCMTENAYPATLYAADRVAGYAFSVMHSALFLMDANIFLNRLASSLYRKSNALFASATARTLAPLQHFTSLSKRNLKVDTSSLSPSRSAL